MRKRHRSSLFAAMSLLAVNGIAGPEHKNLQVLPKTNLKKMMDGFSAQLGVKCTFCHVLEQYETDERPTRPTPAA